MAVDAGRPHTPLWTLKASQLLGAAAWACLGRFIQVFWSDIGLSRGEIGVLSLASTMTSFVGQLFWSWVTDRRGEYKTTLVSTALIGTSLTFLNLLPAVQQSFELMLLVTCSWNFFLSTGGPIIDAMCLAVLAEQDTGETYGDQRLWCALGWGGMSLAAGQIIDLVGINSIFWGFGLLEAVYMSICLIFMPMPKPAARGGGQTESDAQSPQDGPEGAPARPFWTLEVLWFFVNLSMYGLAMSLVETFLLVFLNEDFDNAPKLLLGSSTAMMCLFEIPVFKYIERVWTDKKERLTTVLAACKVVLALRCFCYTLLPPSSPWLVLLVEPLHGFTFAAMWSAAVEYSQRIAPPGCVARMQALVNGIYYQGAMGLGSALWGPLVSKPPRGLGFGRCFLLDAAGIVVWGAVWQAGLLALRRRSSLAARDVGSAGQPLAGAPAGGL